MSLLERHQAVIERYLRYNEDIDNLKEVYLQPDQGYLIYLVPDQETQQRLYEALHKYNIQIDPLSWGGFHVTVGRTISTFQQKVINVIDELGDGSTPWVFGDRKYKIVNNKGLKMVLFDSKSLKDAVKRIMEPKWGKIQYNWHITLGHNIPNNLINWIVKNYIANCKTWYWVGVERYDDRVRWFYAQQAYEL